MEHLKTWGLNFLFVSWSAAMISECVSWTVGVLAGLSLIWFNVERAITTRQERNKKDEKIK